MPYLRGKGNSMTDRNTIKKFIANLNVDPPATANFSHKLSYWWSSIMIARFSVDPEDKGEIIYNPISNSFAVIINGEAFNAHGPIPLDIISDYMGWDFYYRYHTDGANKVMQEQIYLMEDEDWESFLQAHLPSQEDINSFYKKDE